MADARSERAAIAVAQAESDLRRTEQLAKQNFVAATELESDRLALYAARKDWLGAGLTPGAVLVVYPPGCLKDGQRVSVRSVVR